MFRPHRLNHKVKISIWLEDGESIYCMLCGQEVLYAIKPVVMYADPHIDREPSIALYHPSCYEHMIKHLNHGQ
jgi:hypothetical protein